MRETYSTIFEESILYNLLTCHKSCFSPNSNLCGSSLTVLPDPFLPCLSLSGSLHKRKNKIYCLIMELSLSYSTIYLYFGYFFLKCDCHKQQTVNIEAIWL